MNTSGRQDLREVSGDAQLGGLLLSLPDKDLNGQRIRQRLPDSPSRPDGLSPMRFLPIRGGNGFARR